jgi:hypothetical protein
MTTGAENAQVTDEQLKAMSPEEIVKAEDDGRLDVLLGRRAMGTGTGPA